ncbi:hypothetical protein Tco_0971384 [Tanacetum coccineum]
MHMIVYAMCEDEGYELGDNENDYVLYTRGSRRRRGITTRYENTPSNIALTLEENCIEKESKTATLWNDEPVIEDLSLPSAYCDEDKLSQIHTEEDVGNIFLAD